MKKCTLHWVILSIVAIGYVACEAKINLDAIKNLLTVPDADTVIEDNQYQNKGYEQVTIPAGVLMIGAETFADNKFTRITIPASVEEIGDGAFTGNPGLTKVVLSSTLYGKLTGKLDWIFGEQVTTYQDHKGEPLTSPSIPPDTTEITKDTYKDKGYTSVVIPTKSVTTSTIADGAFTGNPELYTVILSSALYKALNSRLGGIFGEQVVTYQDHDGTILNIGGTESGGTRSFADGTFTIKDGVLTIKKGTEQIITGGTSEEEKIYKVLQKIRGQYTSVVLPKSIQRVPIFINNKIETVTFLGEDTLRYYQSSKNKTSFHTGSFIRNPLEAFIIPRGSWSKVIDGIDVTDIQNKGFTSKIAYMVNRLRLTFCFARGKSCASREEGSGRYTTEVTIHLQEDGKRVGTITIPSDTKTKKRQIALSIPEDTAIKASWFQNMYLNTVRIPKSVTSTIADEAFTNNAALTTVILSSMLYKALEGSNKLEGIFGTQVTIYKDHDGTILNAEGESTTTKPPMETSELKQASMKLTSKFYAAAVKDSQENVLVSPYSLKVLFSLASLGFSKNNEEQLARAMFLDTNKDYLTAVFDQFRALNADMKDGVEINSANRIWIDKSFTLKDGYTKYAHQYAENFYDKVDFVNDPSVAQETINKEISRLTGNKIPKLFKTISSDTEVVLANALYFNAEWKHTFEVAKPKQWKNHNGTNSSDGIKFHNSVTKNDVSMVANQIMYVTITIPYGSIKGKASENIPPMQVAAIPYKDERLSMVVILPLEQKGVTADKNFTKLEESITSDGKSLKRILRNLNTKRTVQLVMPKFTTEWDGNIMPMLDELGMEVLRNVEFSRMSNTSLKITNIKQKTFIDVGLEGTEAAAATGIDGRKRSFSVPPPTMLLNRSFIYLIRDTETGAILFMGRFLAPSPSSS